MATEVEVAVVVHLGDGWRSSWRRRGCSGRGRDALLGVASGTIWHARNPPQLAAPGMVGLKDAEQRCGRGQRRREQRTEVPHHDQAGEAPHDVAVVPRPRPRVVDDGG